MSKHSKHGLIKTLTVAVAGSALALTASPAFAVEADDPTFTPVAGDLIGVGSDTSQHAVHLLAEDWNAQSPAPAVKVASFAATGAGTITLPSGAIARPNGSGAGKALLYGAGRFGLDFLRARPGDVPYADGRTAGLTFAQWFACGLVAWGAWRLWLGAPALPPREGTLAA